MRNAKSLALLVLASVWGCGGGGGGSSAPTGGGNVPLQVGIASLQLQGTPKVLTIGGSNSVLSSSVAGASITSMVLAPPIPSQPLIVAGDSAGLLWLLNRGVLTQISKSSTIISQLPQFTFDGRIVFLGLDYKTFTYQIYSCNIDGSELAKRTTSTHISSSTHFSWSPDNTKLIYDDGNGALYTSSTAGTGETPITVTGVSSIQMGSWSPDGTRITFTGSTVAIPSSNVFVSNANGSSVVPLTGLPQSCSSAVFSADGSIIAYNYSNQANSSQINFLDSFNGHGLRNTNIVNLQFDIGPSFSPDGKNVIYEFSLFPTSGIRRATYLGTSPTDLWINNTTDPNLVSPTYQKQFKARKYIGLGGVMGTGCSGLIFNQLHSDISSIVTFAAITPSTATITPSGISGTGGDIGYVLHGDQITSLKYTNGFYVAINSLVPGTANALLTVSASDGTVANVAPFVKTRAAGVFGVKVGGKFVYDAEFTALYDAKGKNIMPNGASHIEVDATTGRLIGSR